MAFTLAFVVALEDCDCGCHYNKNMHEFKNIEHCLLKRVFKAVKRFNCDAGII